MKRTIAIISAAMTFATACTEQRLQPDSGKQTEIPLSLSVIATESSRSLINEGYLINGSEIGITLTDSQGRDYDGLGYNNVRFTAAGSSGNQSWYSGQDVMLSASTANLYAYYPYSAEVRDISSIPVKADSDVQTDYMYAEVETGLNNHNSEALVRLHHALAAVRLSIFRGTYSGKGIISKVSIYGENMATEGLLNATDGSLSYLEGTGEVIAPAISPVTVSTDAVDIDILAIPTGRKSSINIEIIMDGESFELSTDAIKLEQGTVSIIEIDVNNSSVNIFPVRVSAWKYNGGSSSALGKSFDISLGGDTDGMNLSSSIENDGSVKIVAEPLYEGAEINPISFSGDADMTESIDALSGNRTIILSNIQSDISVEFNSYCLWITAIYKISSTTSDSHLVYMKGSPNKTLCARMKVDGEEIAPANFYRFSSTGEHTVQLCFKDKRTIPSYAFYNNSNVKEISIPEGVSQMDTYSISYCSSLESVNLPQSMVYGAYESMTSNSKLKTIVLPDNLEMGYSFLKDCTALEHITLPKNLKKIAASLLCGCSALKQIEIPESVTSIEENAFKQSGLTSLALPQKVSSAPTGMCLNCSSLESVTFRSSLTSIGESCFQYCSKLKQINDAATYSLTIPAWVRSVGAQAFDGCDLFTSLNVPASLTSIGNGAFAMDGISSVSVDSSNPVYEKRGQFNGIVEKETDILIHGCKNATVVPESIKEIGAYAYYSTSIASIELHEGIRAIGDYAFYRTYTLASVISRAMTPPALGANYVFNNPASGGILKVPSESLEAYKAEWMKSNDMSRLGYSSYRWSIKALADGE